MTPEHTRSARDALGPDALLAPEQTVVLEDDADEARAIARQWLARYLQLPNYADNWVRSGFDRSESAPTRADSIRVATFQREAMTPPLRP